VTKIPCVPRVTVIVEFEGTPRFVVTAATSDEREQLAWWVRQTQPDLDQLLRDLASAKKAA
jgi:hypothetical protein